MTLLTDDARPPALLHALIDAAGSPIVCLDRTLAVTIFNAAAERAFGRSRAEVVGRPYTNLLPDLVRRKVAGDLERVLSGAAIDHFENAIRRPDGTITVVLWSITPLSDADRPNGVLAIGQDVTTLQRMHERLVRQTRHLVGLSRIDRATITLQPPPAIATVAVRHVVEATACKTAAVIGYDLHAGLAVRLAACGDASRTPETRALEASDFITPPWPESPADHLTVPLVANAVRLGSLVAASDGGTDALTLGEIEILGQIADRLAIALDNARLFDDERRARRQFQAASARLVEIQETERRRLARELHDDIGQGLTGLKLDLEAQTRARGDDPDLARALALVHDLLARVRHLSLDLRPTSLDDLGLVPAVASLIERDFSRTGLEVTLDHHGGGRFQPEVETAAFRIIQEALTNVVRHAGTRQALVRLDATQAALHVSIEDGGCGFDPQRVPREASTGLSSLHERAAMLDGQLTIVSSPGQGTVVRAILPRTRSATLEAPAAPRRTAAR
jgi:PAS domain S-box-containing protein